MTSIACVHTKAYHTAIHSTCSRSVTTICSRGSHIVSRHSSVQARRSSWLVQIDPLNTGRKQLTPAKAAGIVVHRIKGRSPPVQTFATTTISSVCSHFAQMWSLELVAVVAFVGFIVGSLLFLVSLAVADADLALLFRGKHSPTSFENKVVWITGASQGLGESLAKYLAGHGAKLILSSRRKEALEAVKAQCNVPSSQIEVLPFDLCGTYEQLADAAAAADRLFDGAGVDFLMHNAGASQHALAEATTAPVTRSLFDLNTLGPILLTRAALPAMLRRKRGQIVVVTSMAAKVPSPGQAVYSGCKMALWGYFSTLATEVADQGVGVTICCPGPVATGSASQPRVVYGPTGKVTRQVETSASSKSRVPLERCVELIANAMAHKVDECWIAKHPVLLMAYIMQYLPWLGWLVMKKVGPKRARAVQDGKNGYDASKLIFGKKA